jgi:hypothetical protein
MVREAADQRQSALVRGRAADAVSRRRCRQTQIRE